MYCCHTIKECYNLLSGVKLSVRSFSFILRFQDQNPLKIKSKGIEKNSLFCQRTDDSQDLRYRTLVIADYEYVRNFLVFTCWLQSYG